MLLPIFNPISHQSHSRLTLSDVDHIILAATTANTMTRCLLTFTILREEAETCCRSLSFAPATRKRKRDESRTRRKSGSKAQPPTTRPPVASTIVNSYGCEIVELPLKTLPYLYLDLSTAFAIPCIKGLQQSPSIAIHSSFEQLPRPSFG